jgi:hypothetical protein
MTRRNRWITLAVAGVVLLGIAALVTWRILHPSYDERVRRCAQALDDRLATSNRIPGPCHGIKDKDYSDLLLATMLHDKGWVKDNGDVDILKMLRDGQ